MEDSAGVISNQDADTKRLEQDIFGDIDDDLLSASVSSYHKRPPKRALIALVELSSKMLDSSSELVENEHDRQNRVSPIQFAMKVMYKAMRGRVRLDGGASDLVGLIFYGTSQNRNEHHFDNVFAYHKLAGIDVERLRDLRRISVDPASLVGEVGGFADPVVGKMRQGCPLDRAMWLSHFWFSGAKLKADDEQTIWLFTRNDNPHDGNEVLKSKLERRFEDAFIANTNVVLWPLTSAATDNFDENCFYDKVIVNGNEISKKSKLKRVVEQTSNSVNDIESEMQNSYICWNDSDRTESLDDIVRRQEVRKRKVEPVILDLGNGISIGIKLLSPIVSTTIPQAVKFDAMTQKLVRLENSLICNDTGRALSPNDVATFFQYGNHSRVFVNEKELKALRTYANPARMKVVCFKPQASIKIYHSIRTPYIAVPNETSVRGSTVAFNALRDAMVSQKLAAYCVGNIHRYGVPKFIALLPRQKNTALGDFASDHFGFDAIILPWANDIREIKLSPVEECHSNETPESKPPVQETAFESLVDKACDVINTMTVKPGPDTGIVELRKNPHIHRHYAAIEYVAIRDAHPDEEVKMDWDSEIDDETAPSTELFIGKRKIVQDAFLAAWGGVEDEETKARQIKANKALKSNSSKRVEKPSKDLPWREAAQSGLLGKLTVPVLKAACKECQISEKGKKSELVERLKTQFQEIVAQES